MHAPAPTEAPSAKRRLPPGPKLVPLATAQVYRDAEGFFTAARARYGDPFTAPLAMGRAVVTGSPEGIRQIFSAPPDLFEPYAPGSLGPVVGDHSLLLLTGEAHRRERKLLMPSFHGERMRAYGDTMHAVALERAARLAEGQRFTALDLGQAISLDVIIRTVFGVEEDERVEQFFDAIQAFTDAVSPIFLFFPALQRPLLGGGPWVRFRAAFEHLDGLLQEQIDRRRAQGAGGEDILSLLLEVKDEAGEPLRDGEVKDELRTMLIAGHETTAVSLAWALYFLHRNGDVRARLLAELSAFGEGAPAEEVARLPYLSAVCDEALRLHPVLPFVPRRLVRPMTFLGYDLEPGMAVMASVVLAHRNPVVYSEPERFRPERFLERKPSPFEYLPFGGGARRCLGAAFAHFEMRVVLGALLSRFRFRLDTGKELGVVRKHLTLVPEAGVPMTFVGAA